MAVPVTPALGLRKPADADAFGQDDFNLNNDALDRAIRPVVNVQSAGVKGDGTDTTTALKTLFEGGNLDPGDRVVFPMPSVEYKVADRIVPVTPGVEIVGPGWHRPIRQTAWGMPVFELRGLDDMTVRGLYVRSTEPRNAIGGPAYDGNGARVHSAGIYAADCSRLLLADLRVSGFVCGVMLRGNPDGVNRDDDNAINGLLVDTVDWGVLYSAQNRHRFYRVRGSYLQSQDFPHLLYGSEGLGSPGVSSLDGEIASCFAFDSIDYPYSFKNEIGLRAHGLYASGTRGLLALDDVQDAVFEKLRGRELGDSGSGAIFAQNAMGSCDRNTLDGVTIDQAAGVDDEAMIWAPVGLTGDDNVFLNFVARLSAAPVGRYGLRIRGNRNELDGVSVFFKSGAGRAILLESGDGHRVSRPSVRNAQIPIEILAAATNPVVDYDPADLPSTLSVVSNAAAAATPARLSRRESHKQINYSAAGVTPDASAQRTLEVHVTSNAAWAINSPTNAAPGLELRIVIENTSGGAVTAPTWGAAFVLDGGVAPPAPAAGKARHISFVYDGNRWVETGRSTADV